MSRIFLIGFMGAGKTTLGVALSHEVGMEFVDMDWYMEKRYRKTVRELFVERGEEEFRRIEQRILHEVGEFENVIISTGGGAPCFFDNMDYMNRMGDTVFLEVSVERLFQRLKSAKSTRPVLMDKTDGELREFISLTLAQRMPCYGKANYRFVADSLEDKSQIEDSVAAFRRLLRI